MTNTTGNHQDAPSRAQELLSRYFESTLSATESLELTAIWDRVEGLGNDAVLDGQIESALRYFGAARRESFYHVEPETPWEPDLDELVRLAAQSPSLPRHETLTPSARTVGAAPPIAYDAKKSKPLLPLKILIPSLLLVFGLMVYLEFRPASEEIADADDPFGPFPARVLELIDATFEEAEPVFKKGRRLDAGPVSLLAGLMEIEYKNGIRIVLEGPARYHVETPMEAACDFGKLSADVPPAGRGFTVTTPKMTVRDLGTKFVLDVAEDKTELQVIEGEVEANWLTRDWLPFKAGRGVERRSGNEPRNFVADPKSFVSRETVESCRNEYVSRRQTAWSEHRTGLQADPSLVYAFVPENAARLAKISGSREGKNAVRFRNARDRFETSIGGEYRGLTLLATVRLDELHRQPSTLAMNDGFYSTSGEFHWQIDQLGALHFNMHYGPGDFRRFSTKPVLGERDCRTWMTLAVVMDPDRKTVTHYRDGRPVAAFPWTPIPVRIGKLSIGNDPDISRKRSRAFFRGGIEEFQIFSRALDAVEIEKFYRNNI